MIPLFKPYMPELPELDAILHSGALAFGKYAIQFEELLKGFLGTPYLVVTNSFHTAVSVAVTTMGLAFGDEVVASPMACLASTQPYLSSGMKVKWCDVDPKRGTIDPDSLEKCITPKTRAIVHNHFCGYPGHIDEVNAIGKRHGIPVIDDGIECFGSEYKGRKIGNCGTDATVFSLTAVRIPNTVDGGIVIFKDRELYEKSLRIRDCGIDRENFRDDIGEINPDCDICELGYSATMSNVNGYIGMKQMEMVGRLLAAHRLQADKWKGFFAGQSAYIPICCEEGNPNYWVFGLLADNKRETIKKFRAMDYYASGVHMRNDLYGIFGMQDGERKGVEEFYGHFVALPCGWWMDQAFTNGILRKTAKF